MSHRRRAVTLLLGDAGQDPTRAVEPGGHRRELDRALERRARVIELISGIQGPPQGDVQLIAAVVLRRQPPQRLETVRGIFIGVCIRFLRRPILSLGLRIRLALRRVEGSAQRAELGIDRGIETRLERVEVEAGARERRIRLQPVAVRANQRLERRLAVFVDDVLDEDRGLEIGRARWCPGARTRH